MHRKSQIAIEYGHLYSQKRPDHWVFWVYAASKDRFEQSYSDIAINIGLLESGEKGKNAVEVVSRWLSNPNNGPWLMIIDNADNNEVFFQATDGQRPFVDKIPQCSHGAVLITSRTQTGADIAMEPENEIHVRAFDEATSLQLLSKKLGKKLDNQDEARELASELEHIALALTQAARYISSTKQSIADYLRLFRQEEQRQVSLLDKDWKELRRDASVSNAVLTSWRITWDQLRKECNLAAQLLARMSLLDRQRIAKFLVLRFENSHRQDRPDHRRVEAMSVLLQYGLCWELGQQSGSRYSMHRLVQVCTKAWLREAGKLPAWERNTVAVVARFARNVWLVADLDTHALAVLPYVISSGRSRNQLDICPVLMEAASSRQRGDTVIELLDRVITFARSRSNVDKIILFELVLLRTSAKLDLDPASVSLAELESLRIDCSRADGDWQRSVAWWEFLIIEKRYPEDEKAIAAFEALLEGMKNEPRSATFLGPALALGRRLLPRCAWTRQFGRARRALSCVRQIFANAMVPNSYTESIIHRLEIYRLGLCSEKHEETALLSRIPFDRLLDGSLVDNAHNVAYLSFFLVVFYIRWDKYKEAEAVFNKVAAWFGKDNSGAPIMLPCLTLRLTHRLATDPRAYLQVLWDQWGTSLAIESFEKLWCAYTNGVVHEVDWRGDFWFEIPFPW